MLATWFANQAVGFGLLHYPHTGSTLAWGAAIGIAALAGLAAAGEVRRGVGRDLWAAPLGLVAAFTAYEAVLLATALLLRSGLGAFTPAMVLRLFAINAAALALLAGAERLAAFGRIHGLPRRA